MLLCMFFVLLIAKKFLIYCSFFHFRRNKQARYRNVEYRGKNIRIFCFKTKIPRSSDSVPHGSQLSCIKYGSILCELKIQFVVRKFKQRVQTARHFSIETQSCSSKQRGNKIRQFGSENNFADCLANILLYTAVSASKVTDSMIRQMDLFLFIVH